MKNNKILRTVITLTLLVVMLIPITALASENYFYSFEYTDRDNHQEPYHKKGDTEQSWISLCITPARAMFPVQIFSV